MVYLDASALVKLVLPEPESAALWAELSAWRERVSSALARVELMRAVGRARAGARAVRRAEQILARVALVPLDDDVLHGAARLRPWELRSLEAIHLATASVLGADLGAFVAYDTRLADAARRAGLPLRQPK